MLKDRRMYKELMMRATRVNDDNHRFKHFCPSLNAMLTFLKRDVYDLIARENPSFNAHGEMHAGLIIELCDEILCSNYISNADYAKTEADMEKMERNLKGDELFVLCAAALWHDAAMIDGRPNHAINLKKPFYRQKLIESLNLFDIQTAEFYCDIILNIACSHSDDNTLIMCRTSQDTRIVVDKTLIRTKALAGILRLCDELSDDKTRSNSIAITKVPSSSLIYWLHSKYIDISEIKMNPTGGLFSNNEVYIRYIVPCEHLFEKRRLNNDYCVSLHQFIINRIGKVHAEMSMCCPLFSEFAYIDNLSVDFTISISERQHHKLDPIKLVNSISSVHRPQYWDNISKSIVALEFPDYKADRIQKLINKIRLEV